MGFNRCYSTKNGFLNGFMTQLFEIIEVFTLNSRFIFNVLVFYLQMKNFKKFRSSFGNLFLQIIHHVGSLSIFNGFKVKYLQSPLNFL